MQSNLKKSCLASEECREDGVLPQHTAHHRSRRAQGRCHTAQTGSGTHTQSPVNILYYRSSSTTSGTGTLSYCLNRIWNTYFEGQLLQQLVLLCSVLCYTWSRFQMVLRDSRSSSLFCCVYYTWSRFQMVLRDSCSSSLFCSAVYYTWSRFQMVLRDICSSSLFCSAVFIIPGAGSRSF